MNREGLPRWTLPPVSSPSHPPPPSEGAREVTVPNSRDTPDSSLAPSLHLLLERLHFLRPLLFQKALLSNLARHPPCHSFPHLPTDFLPACLSQSMNHDYLVYHLLFHALHARVCLLYSWLYLYLTQCLLYLKSYSLNVYNLHVRPFTGKVPRTWKWVVANKTGQ